MHRFVGVNGDAITAGMINQIVHVLKSHFCVSNLRCKNIWSGYDRKALAPGHDHAILPAGAVNDEDIAHAVVAADDPDVAVIRVKDEIAGQCV